MYSNKILNFQDSTAILNACTKKSGNLLNTPHSLFNAKSIFIHINSFISNNSVWHTKAVPFQTIQGSVLVLVKAMDCGIVVSLYSSRSYYIYFWANTFGKGMNPLILPAMG